MSDKANDFFNAFWAGRLSRRELMAGAGRLGVNGGERQLPTQRRRDAGARRGLRLEEILREKDPAAAEQTSLRRCDDRRSRELQDASRG